MRLFIISIFTLIIVQLSAQEANDPSPKYSNHIIGLSAQFDGVYGLLYGVDYKYVLSDRWLLYSGLSANHFGSFAFRTGANYSILDLKFVNFKSGLGLAVLRFFRDNYSEIPLNWELELPILLEIPISERFSIHTSFLLRAQLHRARSGDGSGTAFGRYWPRLRHGATYRL